MIELKKNGRPIAPIMKQNYDQTKLHYPEKVRDHPVWAHEEKPWAGYPERSQHTSIENHYLYRRPLEYGVGNYANLGTFRGGSADAISQGLKEIGGGKLYTVDLFNINGALTINKIANIFRERGILEYVEFCKGFTHEWPERLNHLKFKFIFIDADHHYETCKNDFELWSPLLEDTGVIAFHDVNFTTVDRVLEELDDDWELVDHVWKIKSFRRRA